MSGIIRRAVGYGPQLFSNLTPNQQSTVRQVNDAGMRVDGAIALGARAMDGVEQLDNRRRLLAGADPTLNVVLAEIEAETIAQITAIQRAMYSTWNVS